MGKWSLESRKRLSASIKGKRSGANNPKWKGGKMLIGGYWYVLSPQHPNKTKMGYVAEHRLIMEKHLGRLLNKSEIVHHQNRNKLDNRIDNLVLLGSQSEHGLEHSEFHFKSGCNPAAKLTKKDVDIIRKLSSQGFKNTELAKLFNVDSETILRVKYKHTWKDAV